METGWQKISGKWSYLGGTDDGIMRIGWQKIGTNWYYFNSSGYMLTGWQKIGTKWYYFGESDDGSNANRLAEDWWRQVLFW